MSDNPSTVVTGTTVFGPISNNRGAVVGNASGPVQVIGSQTINHYPPGESHGQSPAALAPKKKEIKFLRCLNASPYRDRKERNPDRVPGTCEWFISHKLFRDWQESKSSRMLWVSADPGCGKSVLAKHLVNSVLQTTESTTVCYFFFKDDFEDQRNVVSALCCILLQLFTQKPALLSDAILYQFDIDGETFTSSFNDLWQTLVNVAKDENAGEIICLLDAFDECEGQGRALLAQKLCELYGTPKDFNLKFLLTSRPWGEIRQGFQSLKIPRLPMIHLSGEGDKEMKRISQEINIFIKARVQDIGTRLKLTHEERKLLLGGLMRVPNRTYLWVHLTLDLFVKERYIDKIGILKATSHLPKTINEAYDRILSRSHDPEKAKKILHIIVAATRPLTVAEMAFAFVLRENHRSYDALDLDLIPEDRFREIVRDICGLFVTIIDSRLYLLHQTAKEFLVQNDIANSPKGVPTNLKWKHSLRPQESHHILTEICIWHLLFEDFENSPLGEDGPLSQYVENHTFLNYSASHWIVHFRELQIESQGAMTQLILRICEMSSQRCLTWFRIYWTSTNTDFPRGFSNLMILSYFGLSTAVEHVLKMGGIDLNSRDDTYQRSALSWAAGNGFDAVVKLLINDVSTGRWIVRLLSGKRAKINTVDRYGRTALSYAVWSGNMAVVELLIRAGARADSKDEIGGTPLSYAVCNGYKEMIELLLKGDTQVDFEDISKELLFSAAKKGHEAVVRLLLETGKVEVDSKDEYGRTPLSWAVESGHEAVVKLLLETGKAEADSEDWYSRTPISLVARSGHEAVAKLLLETGKIEVDSKDWDYRRTPLSLAAESGHEAIVRLLLETGKVNVDSKDRVGRTPLSWAVERGHEAVAKLLQSHLNPSQ